MVQSYKFKRASDFFLSFFGLVFCAPLLVFISFVLLVTLPGNMLFKQQRVGMNTRKFVLYKFRTMKTQCDMKGNLLSEEERFKLDVWYVDHQSILLDIKILFITIVRLFQRKGINAEGHVTMPKFTGSIKRGVDE